MTPLPSRSRYVALPGGRYHLREWGNADAPLLLMLHGWMDVSGTFQFLVEALRKRWHVVAPDWLGYGLSEWRGKPYWMAELLHDLDALADQLSPDQPLRIVGHSMGGNIASLWAGTRPERLERLVMLESFGHPKFTHKFVQQLHQQWLDDGRNGPRETTYANREALQARLCQANPRLSAEQAARIVTWLARDLDSGRVGLCIDPWQRNVLNHLVHQDEEFFSAWRSITAPVLWMTADDSDTLRRLTASYGGEAALLARMAHMRALRHVQIAEAGHNLHHDQPEAVALAIEQFLTTPQAE